MHYSIINCSYHVVDYVSMTSFYEHSFTISKDHAFSTNLFHLGDSESSLIYLEVCSNDFNNTIKIDLVLVKALCSQVSQIELA